AVTADRARVVDDHGQGLGLPAASELEQVGRAHLQTAAAGEHTKPNRRPAPPQGRSTTIAAPPRRGSPPPEKAPLGSLCTAWTPPKKRLRSRKRPIGRPACSRLVVSIPGSAY